MGRFARGNLALALGLWTVVLGLGATACSRHQSQEQAPAQGSPRIQPIPVPDLTGAEAAVKEQLTSELGAVEALQEDPATRPQVLAEAYGDLGLLYVTYTFLEAAEVCFKNARSLLPQDFRWLYLVGYLYQIQGRLEEAATALDGALELRPDDLPSLLRLGTVRVEATDYAAAEALFRRALALDSASAFALDGLGKVAAAQGDPQAAVEFFEQALAQQPSASSIRHALGLAYRSLGDLERARTNLEQGGEAPVLFQDPLLSPVVGLGKSAEFYLVTAAQAFSEGRFERAAANYRQALKLNPQDFTARKSLGFCLEKLGDIAGAMEELHLALRLGESGEEERDVLERAEIYRILGGLKVLYGREPEAIDHFQSALELNPDLLDARLKLANALARSGRFEEAVEHYDRVLAIRPNHVDTHIWRATALINLGRHQEALEVFGQAVRLEPENAVARQRYAEALEFLGQNQSAQEQRSLAQTLSAEDRQRVQLLVNEATRLEREGRYKGAVERYREVLRLAPDTIDARYQLAALLGHLGQMDEALLEFGQVIASTPRHGPARRGEAMALLLLGRYGVLRTKLQEGLSVLPGDRQLAHTLARVLATAPDDRVRDGRLALELARKVYETKNDLRAGETLAMAYAEAGQFDRAVELMSRLLAAVEGSARPDLAHELRLKVVSFQGREPWRALSPNEIIEATLASSAPL